MLEYFAELSYAFIYTFQETVSGLKVQNTLNLQRQHQGPVYFVSMAMK